MLLVKHRRPPGEGMLIRPSGPFLKRITQSPQRLAIHPANPGGIFP
jgi:hypothetical protein